MSSLRSSMVNVINRTGYEAVKAKSISLHGKRTQIKCIEPHAPRETHRHSQNGSAQRVGTLCLPCPPSFPHTISKSCFHGIPYTHICNQPIYLSIYIYMGLLFTFFSSICSLQAKITFQWMPLIGHILSQETQPPVAVQKAQHLSCLHSFHSIGTQFSISVWKILHCFELPLLDSKTAI